MRCTLADLSGAWLNLELLRVYETDAKPGGVAMSAATILLCHCRHVDTFVGRAQSETRPLGVSQ